MAECKQLKGRECDPAECLFQSATAAASQRQLFEKRKELKLDKEEIPMAWTIKQIAEMFRDCALEVLAERDPHYKRMHREAKLHVK